MSKNFLNLPRRLQIFCCSSASAWSLSHLDHWPLVHHRCLMEDVPCFWYLFPLLSHLSTWICSLVLNILEAIRDTILKVSSLKPQLLSNVIILYGLCLARTGSPTDCLKEQVYGFAWSDSWILKGWVFFKALNNLTLNEKQNSKYHAFHSLLLELSLQTSALGLQFRCFRSPLSLNTYTRDHARASPHRCHPFPSTSFSFFPFEPGEGWSGHSVNLTREQM